MAIDFQIPTSQTIIQKGATMGILNDAQITSTYNNNAGGQSKIVKEGLLPDILPYMQLCRQQGYSYNVSNGEVYRIEIDLPWDYFVENESDPSISGMLWDISFQPYEKFIFNCRERPFISVLSNASKDLITLKIKNNDIISEPVTRDDYIYWVQGSIAFRLRQSNIEGKQDFVPILKRTFTMRSLFSPIYPNATYESPTYDNVVFTTTQMLSTHVSDVSNLLYKIPQSIISQMPYTLNLQDQAGNINAVEGWNCDSQGIVTFVGWRQLPIEIHSLAYNKQTITRQWTFNAWSAGQFGLYDTAMPGGDFTLSNLQTVVNRPG